MGCAAQAIVECAGGEVLQFDGGKACDAGKPVVYGKEHPLNPFFVVYGKRETRKAPSPETEAFIGKYKDCKRLSKGSSLKLLMVAEGAAHVYPRLAPTSEWDTCAAQAIVECAGGEVPQFDGGKACDAGKPVVYGKEHPLNPFF